MALNWLNQEIGTTDQEQSAQTTFGIESFRPGQSELITAAMAGKNVLGIMPTGSGKSLVFQLPRLLGPKGRTTLVVSPLLALMRNQVKNLQDLGISAAAYNSSLDDDKRAEVLSQTRDGALAFLFTSAEQLGKTDFIDGTRGAPFDSTAVDEAHCISQWGHDFRPSYLEIDTFNRRRNIGQTLAFTATASTMVQDDIRKNLNLKDAATYESDPHRPNLNYQVLKTPTPVDKKAKLLELLKANPDGSRIIYCSSRIEAFALQKSLQQSGIQAGLYHGKMETAEREQTEQDFLSDKTQTLIATNAFGMGIDKPNIRLIVHYNVPGNVEAYMQETGRAGRDGEKANCALLYRPEDLVIQNRFLQAKTPDLGFVLMIYKALKRQLEHDRQTKIPGHFTLNRVALYIATQRKDEKGKITKRDTEVNAAIDILKNIGALKDFQNICSFNPAVDEGSLEELLGQISTVRSDIAKATLGQMVKYAEHPNPSQEVLVELMRQDLRVK